MKERLKEGFDNSILYIGSLAFGTYIAYGYIGDDN